MRKTSKEFKNEETEELKNDDFKLKTKSWELTLRHRHCKRTGKKSNQGNDENAIPPPNPPGKLILQPEEGATPNAPHSNLWDKIIVVAIVGAVIVTIYIFFPELLRYLEPLLDKLIAHFI